MTIDNTPHTTTIRVTNEFKSMLATHGQFGERFEDILIRLLGKKFLQSSTGDKDTTSYTKEDTDTKRTKKMLKEKNK